LHHISVFAVQQYAIYTAALALRNWRGESYSYVVIHSLPFTLLEDVSADELPVFKGEYLLYTARQCHRLLCSICD
jgi:hypothetical protein